MADYTTIDNPELYFQNKLWTGTGSSNALTLDGSENMQPDWVWIKSRSQNHNHKIYDSVRGVTKTLGSNESDAEATVAQSLTAFGTDGFTVGTDVSVNESSQTFVAWNWKAGGSASSNSNGSITSSVSASTTAGFSIATYTGTGSNATVGHGLGVTPAWIMVKCRSESQDWFVYHQGLGGNVVRLNGTSAAESSSGTITSPNSTIFNVGTAQAVNKSSGTYVAYCFAEKQGYSKFGKYTGNGNADGPFIYTGFRPAWVLIKNTGRSDTSWTLYDNKRPGFNSDNAYLLASSNDTELSDKDIDLLSNGFKPLLSNNAVNTSGDSYIYMSFAENPFVTAGTKAAGTAR